MRRDRILVLVGLAAGAVLIVPLLLYRKDQEVPRAEDRGRDARHGEVTAGSPDSPRADVAKSSREEVLEPSEGAGGAGATDSTVDDSVTSRVRILDSEGRPLPGGFVLFGKELRRFEADEEGRAVLTAETGGQHEGAAFADGRSPGLFVLGPAGELEVRLQEDPGVELSIHWAGSSSPVTGASVRLLHCGWPEPSAEWRQAAWRTVYPESFACDSQGGVLVPGVAFTFHREDSIEGSEALLVVEHPEALETWVSPANFRRDPFSGDWTTQEVILDRTALPSVLEFVDPAGKPWADRPLRITWWGAEIEARTDAAGRFELAMRPSSPPYFDPCTDYFGDLLYELDLGGGRTWAGSRYVSSDEYSISVREVAAFEEIHGSVRHALSTRFEVASDAVLWPDQATPDEPPPVYPSWEAIDRQPIGADGSFHLDRGWQGAVTSVLLVDTETHAIVAWAIWSRGVPVELEPAPFCRVELQPVGLATEDFALELVGTGVLKTVEAPRLSLRASDLPRVLDLPRGTYTLIGNLFGVSRRFAEIDARRESALVEVNVGVPGRRILQGTVTGTLSGPIQGARLQFSDANHLAGSCVSDEDGRFRAEVPDADSWRVFVEWPGPRTRLQSPWISPKHVQVTEDLEAIQFIREEAEIVVRWDREEPVWNWMEASVSRKDEKGRLTWYGSTEMGRRDSWRLFVPPGEYRIDCRPMGRGYVTVDAGVQEGEPFALLAGARNEIDLAATDDGLVELAVDCLPGYHADFKTMELAEDDRPLGEWEVSIEGSAATRPEGQMFLLAPGVHRFRLEGSMHSVGDCDGGPRIPVVRDETIAVGPKEVVRRDVLLAPDR